jgi:hypothetical protein
MGYESQEGTLHTLRGLAMYIPRHTAAVAAAWNETEGGTSRPQVSIHTEPNKPFIDERLGLIIFLISTITSVILVMTMVIREYYFKKHGIDVCPIFGHTRQEQAAIARRRHQNSEQYNADRVLAQELQRQLNEEEREAERLVKRKDRRKWYEYFLTPYSMVSPTSLKKATAFILCMYRAIFS